MTTLRRFSTRTVFAAGAVALLTLSSLAGCSHRDAADGSLDGSAAPERLLAPNPAVRDLDLVRARFIYPLAVGNHWDWRIRVVSQITTDAGPLPPDTTVQPWSAEIVRTAEVVRPVQHDTLLYFIQSEYDPRVYSTPTPNAIGFFMREDREGLFESLPGGEPDVVADGEAAPDPVASELAAYVEHAVADPARRVAYSRAAAELTRKLSIIRLGTGLRGRGVTGASSKGLTMLKFPLRVGASWVERDSPLFVRTVVGHELIRVPLGTVAAWDIRGTSELFGPNDSVNFWYSSLGLVRIHYHVEADAVDNTGAVIGRVATTGDRALTGVRLQGRPVPSSLTAGSFGD